MVAGPAVTDPLEPARNVQAPAQVRLTVLYSKPSKEAGACRSRASHPGQTRQPGARGSHQPGACVCPACKLKMVFRFSNGGGGVKSKEE